MSHLATLDGTTAEPQQSTSELEVCQIVLGLLLPAIQQSPPSLKPGKGAFHDPTTSRLGLLTVLLFLLLTDPAHVRTIATRRDDFARWLIVIALS